MKILLDGLHIELEMEEERVSELEWINRNYPNIKKREIK